VSLTQFACAECEDTGKIWEDDPAYPNMMRCQILVSCSCKDENNEDETSAD
jgi:hypothetical protein